MSYTAKVGDRVRVEKSRIRWLVGVCGVVTDTSFQGEVAEVRSEEWEGVWIFGAADLVLLPDTHPPISCGDGCGHMAQCAVHNEPAMPNGPCNCEGLPAPAPATEGGT